MYHTGVGMAIDWATLGGVIHIVFYMTGGTVSVEVCSAAAPHSWALGTELDMRDFTYPTNFLLYLFADEQTDTLNESLSFCGWSTADTISRCVGKSLH